ncbi:signaling lymphocytic activation molecule-like [Pyxicephalus adspersus]|uniref:signaling lymphocytic activation molecule-like n=1 Tax=Pyxicephalus adspersus TaxID=30357 RepID=UPI003B5BCB80
MFYFFIICFIAYSCFGLLSACSDSVIRLNGTLGQRFTFQSVPFEPESESLTLQLTDKNKRESLLIYNQRLREPTISPDARFTYNKEKSSFEILQLQRENQGRYDITIKNGRSEISCKYDLKVYEKITNVVINITQNVQNDSCIVTMDCFPRTGDNVTFSWTNDQMNFTHNHNRLTVYIPNDNTTRTYHCHVENPVSKSSHEVNLKTYFELCSKTAAKSVDYSYLIFLIIGLFVIVEIVAILIKKRLNRKKIGKLHIQPQSPPRLPPNPEETVTSLNTVYAVVQKKELNEVRPEPFPSGIITVYGKVQKKESEDNLTMIYELAGPSTVHP